MLTSLLVLVAAQTPGAGAVREVTFLGANRFKLSGTLQLPLGEATGKLPAVLLLPGSGPTDRNGNQLPGLITDTQKQIAEALAVSGIASLRFDKRAAHVYAKRWPKSDQYNDFFSYESFIGDAKAAYQYLRAQKEIDPQRCAIAGHSEGGLFALQIAADIDRTKDAPKAIVLIGAAGRTVGAVIKEQVKQALERQGTLKEVEDSYMASIDKAQLAIIQGGPVPSDLPDGLKVLFPPYATKLLRSYFIIEPTKLAMGYSGPVLVINGGNDIQVSATRDAEKLERALRQRKLGTSELFVVPGASHCLKATQGPDDPGFAGPVVPAALDKITGWLLKNLNGEG